MRQRLLWVLIAFASIPLIACAGTLTMTTYYPAPTGYYDYLQANNIGVGTVNVGGHLQVAGYSGGSAYLGPACGVGDGWQKYTGINLNGVSNPSDCNNYNLLSGAGDNQLYINRPTGKNIYLRENNYTQLFLQGSATGDGSGNVGIGLDTPLHKLHVQGDAFFHPSPTFPIGGGVSIEKLDYPNEAAMVLYTDQTGYNFQIGSKKASDGSNYRPGIIVTDWGTVGIGTWANPAERLDVAGGIRSSGNIYTTYSSDGAVYSQTRLQQWGLLGAGHIWIEPGRGYNLNITDNWAGVGLLSGVMGSYNFALGAARNPGLYIGADGNTGIGLTTPSQKLDVTGNTKLLSDTNPLYFTSTWHGYPDAVTNTAEISNDTTVYKTLMIIGNQSARAGRSVSIWDRLTVNGTLTTTGTSTLGGNVGVNSGPSGSYNLYVNGTLGVSGDITSVGGAFVYSDRRLKRNIHPIQDPLAKVMALNGVTFDWKKTHQPSVGLIAQDVEKVFPQLVKADKEGMKSVAYPNLVALLIEAAKAQEKKIALLQQQVEKLNKEVAALKKKNQ